MTDIVIREATLDDAAAMADHMNAIGAEKLDTIPPRSNLTVDQERAFIKDALDNPRAFYLIALNSSRVVGMLSLHGGKRPHDNHAGNLGITVLRDVRGRGIGRQLMLAAIARAKAWDDFCRIELDVVSWNPRAIALYESLGFIKEALKQKAANFRGKPEAEYQMALVW